MRRPKAIFSDGDEHHATPLCRFCYSATVYKIGEVRAPNLSGSVVEIVEIGEENMGGDTMWVFLGRVKRRFCSDNER